MNSEHVLPHIAQPKDIPAPFPCRYIAATANGWEFGTNHPHPKNSGHNERRKLGTTPCEHAAYNWLSTGVAPT